MQKKSLLIFFLISVILPSYSQTDTIFQPIIKYSNQQEYEIAGIDVKGIQFLDKNVIIQVSGLKIGDKIEIPGSKITLAIKKLYRQVLFSHIKITADKIINDKIYLSIELTERPKLSGINITGAPKSEKDKLMKLVGVSAGTQVTSNLVSSIERIVKNYYKEKGFYNTKVSVLQKADTVVENGVSIDVNISKEEKIKISNIFVNGNKEIKANKLKRAMKKTREKSLPNFLKSAKYIEKQFKEDKILLIEKYNELGYRDAIIKSDSIVSVDDNRIDIYLNLFEGNRYYYNNIGWVGNTIYPSILLTRVLKIKKGDTYNKKTFDKRLKEDEDAVHNLYLDNGYLFSQITPYEIVQGEDSINLEIRIYEGNQANINRIIIRGNDKTNEHVARRELYTYPGDLFSKTKIMRSVRELANLGHFDPEKILPDVQPNYENNTVDIIYNVEEKSNDQIELSGGYGAGTIVGSLGLRFSNFSIRNIFNKKAWSPLPTGDGQTLSLRGQTNGSYYNSFNASFIEPWLGGKKPNSFNVSYFTSNQTRVSSYYSVSNVDPDRDQKFGVMGISVGLGRRLNWPDNYFTLSNSIGFNRYKLDNWPGFALLTQGTSNIVTLNTIFARTSIDNPLYTRSGSAFSLGLQFTPPYSLFGNTDYETATDDEKYKWIEYHKWNFNAKLFTPLDRQRKLVFHTKAEYGFLGYYNKNKRSPFEGFSMGGDGMSGYRSYGTDIIGLRGYENNSITPRQGVASLYSKLTMELRYPITLSQSATIYALAFAEAGNAWYEFKDFEPFNLNRSAGVGIRIFLPMFGLLGIDWGYGFDKIPNNPDASGAQFHFVFGQQF